VFFICAITLFLAATCVAQKPKIKVVNASSDHPLWRVDLQSLGYPPNNPDLQRSRNFANFDTISFVAENIVAATFITREFVPDLQRRDDPNHLLPYRLHAIFFDATTGKVVHALDWPTETPSAGIFPRAAGGFVLLTSDRIVSYSDSWAQIKALPYSELTSPGTSVDGIAESPTNKSVVIQFLRGNTALCLIVRTDSLESSPTPCGTLDVFTASDNGIVAPEKLPGAGPFREGGRMQGAYVQYGVTMPDAPAGTPVQVLSPDQASTIRTECNACVGMAQFINNDTMAIYAPTYVSLVDRTGKVGFTQHFYLEYKWIDEFGRPVRASADGQRFAIASNMPPDLVNKQHVLGLHMSTGDIPAEFPLDIEVYDLPAAQWIYTLQINADHFQKLWGFALSPSGQKLALDSGGVIYAFALPPSTTTAK
jgi:hypothetical protein